MHKLSGPVLSCSEMDITAHLYFIENMCAYVCGRCYKFNFVLEGYVEVLNISIYKRSFVLEIGSLG